MKPRHIAILAAFTLIAWSMVSCTTTTTTVTAPDGTVTVTKTTAPAPGAIEAGTAAAQIIATK
jgi:hypothetical protein